MAHPIVFFEIATADLDRARAFYGELFAWTFADAPGASMIDTGGIPGMLNLVPGHAGGESIVPYFAVDDLQASYARALALGAVEVIPPRPIPGRGAFAVFRDRDRNRVGIFATARPPTP